MDDLKPISQNAIEQFRTAMQIEGLVPPDEIKPDGAFHYFAGSGTKSKKKGWYVYREGAIPSGAFGDFKANKNINVWRADIGRPLTATEERDFLTRQNELKIVEQAKKLRIQATARDRTADILKFSVTADLTHPYLRKKRIEPNGARRWVNAKTSIEIDEKSGERYLRIEHADGYPRLRFSADFEGRTEEAFLSDWRDLLLIPMMDGSQEAQSVQFISRSGEKKFLGGGKMQGCYFPLGDFKSPEIVLIAEGYATAATIHEVTGHPVAVAYNAGNLVAVGKALKARHSKARFVICGDDDWQTAGNPGVTMAKAAAMAVEGEYVMPQFGSKRGRKDTDFNDMAALEGKDAVTNFFITHFSANTTFTNDADVSDHLEIAASFSRSHALAPKPGEAVVQPTPDILLQSQRPTPAASSQYHFTSSEFDIIQQIWKDVPRQISGHSETGYDLFLDQTQRIRVCRDHIELAGQVRHRPDQAYAAACKQARHFWGGVMEVKGDRAHCLKAWAYAQVHGVQVTNYVPCDKDLNEAQKIIRSLEKARAPVIRRPIRSSVSRASQALNR